MQVILLEKVANLGNLGDVVRVKDGFARNFLIPTRAARRATPTAIKEFEDKRAELEKSAAEKLATTIVGIDVSEQLAITDVFVIASAETERQVEALLFAASAPLAASVTGVLPRYPASRAASIRARLRRTASSKIA